jgi:hypothetical protein
VDLTGEADSLLAGYRVSDYLISQLYQALLDIHRHDALILNKHDSIRHKRSTPKPVAYLMGSRAMNIRAGPLLILTYVNGKTISV